jgi:hypothetical protein
MLPPFTSGPPDDSPCSSPWLHATSVADPTTFEATPVLFPRSELTEGEPFVDSRRMEQV